MNVLIKKIILKVKQIFNNYVYKIRLLFLLFKKNKVNQHKKFLIKNSLSFNQFDNVLFVFQFHNKKNSCKKVLSPFLNNKVKNIVAFADGCIDGTGERLHKLMFGKNHLVINCNDVHEIKNYRLSVDLAKSLNCQYILLMQDDDIYKNSIFTWVKNAINIMQKFNASIVSGKSGMALCSDFNYKSADNSISNAEFKTYKDKQGDSFYQLGDFDKGKLLNTKKTQDASSFLFAACVFRAPQLVDVSVASKLGFFLEELEPYQYDDHFNSFISWKNGYKIILAPYLDMNSIGIGGMRLYNNVNPLNRPKFFKDKWNIIIKYFGEDMNKGIIQKLVDEENKKLNLENN